MDAASYAPCTSDMPTPSDPTIIAWYAKMQLWAPATGFGPSTFGLRA